MAEYTIVTSDTTYTISTSVDLVSLSSLTDTSIDSLSNGQTLVYNSTTGKWENNTAAGSGDMTKAVYDPQTIEGDAFDRSNHTGTQTASTISDFDTEVSNNASVVANTAKVGVTDQISNIVEDTTPQLGGELDAQSNSIGFTLQTYTGDGTTTVDWTAGNKAKFTFGAQNEIFTFTAPSKPCSLQLIIVQDGIGSRTATWPGTIKWVGGSEPTLSTASGSEDIISFLYDGTNYYGVGSLNFS